MKANLLYKIHENADCSLLLDITRYLYHNNIDIKPWNIQEHMFPPNTIVPTLVFRALRILNAGFGK